MPSILDTVSTPQTSQAVDTITAILNKHAQPTLGDISQASTMRSYNGIHGIQPAAPVTARGVANANAEAEAAPSLGMLDILQKAASTGQGQADAVLNTFKQFAPDQGDLAQLVQAAHEDPEQITPANAASWAARKSQELGLGQLTRETKEATVEDLRAHAAQRRAMAANRGQPIGEAADASDLPSIDDKGDVTTPTPTAAPAAPAPSTGVPAGSVAALIGTGGPSGAVSPTVQPSTRIVTTYQGAKAPAGQMFVNLLGGGVGLAPIPGSANKSASPKPITADAAGKLAMVKQGQDSIPEIKRLMFSPNSFDKSGNLVKGASLDRPTLAQLTAVPFTNARPFIVSPKARQLWTSIYNMTDAKLRLESGAAVPEQEVARTAQAYIGSVIDSPETALYKLKAPEKYFNDFMGLVGSTPSSAAAGASPSAGVPSAAPDKAVQYLKSNPHFADQFDQKYGAGAAAKILGR